MTPKIPAALMARRKAALEAVKSATAARNALDDAMEALKVAISKAKEAETDAEAVEERVTVEIRALLARVVPGAVVADGYADLDFDKAGRLLLCMEDGRDLLVEVE